MKRHLDMRDHKRGAFARMVEIYDLTVRLNTAERNVRYAEEGAEWNGWKGGILVDAHSAAIRELWAARWALFRANSRHTLHRLFGRLTGGAR